MSSTTRARDALTAFHAAHPDVANATGEKFLELPPELLDEHDALLAEVVQEKTVSDHAAQCRMCTDHGPAVTFRADGTVRCDWTWAA